MVETPTSWLHAFSIGVEKRNTRLASPASAAEASTRDLKVVLDPLERVASVPSGLTVRGGRGGCGCTASTGLDEQFGVFGVSDVFRRFEIDFLG